MRKCTIVMTGVICLLMAGCGGADKGAKPVELDQGLINAGLVDSYNNLAMQDAILAQHTLYPYHFVKNGAQLNELGRRDLAVLAGHFKQNPGRLNIRRDNVSPDLYNARVQFVLNELQKAGVVAGRIAVADGMPGGSGISSERIVTILSSGKDAGRETSSGAPSAGVAR